MAKGSNNIAYVVLYEMKKGLMHLSSGGNNLSMNGDKDFFLLISIDSWYKRVIFAA